jgi:hypothetical protein
MWIDINFSWNFQYKYSYIICYYLCFVLIADNDADVMKNLNNDKMEMNYILTRLR